MIWGILKAGVSMQAGEKVRPFAWGDSFQKRLRKELCPNPNGQCSTQQGETMRHLALACVLTFAACAHKTPPTTAVVAAQVVCTTPPGQYFYREFDARKNPKAPLLFHYYLDNTAVYRCPIDSACLERLGKDKPSMAEEEFCAAYSRCAPADKGSYIGAGYIPVKCLAVVEGITAERCKQELDACPNAMAWNEHARSECFTHNTFDPNWEPASSTPSAGTCDTSCAVPNTADNAEPLVSTHPPVSDSDREQALAALNDLATWADETFTGTGEEFIKAALKRSPPDFIFAQRVLDDLPDSATSAQWQLVILILQGQREPDQGRTLWKQACQRAKCPMARGVIEQARQYLQQEHHLEMPACPPLSNI